MHPLCIHISAHIIHWLLSANKDRLKNSPVMGFEKLNTGV